MRYTKVLRAALMSGVMVCGSAAFAQDQKVPAVRLDVNKMESKPLAFPAGFINKELHEVDDIRGGLAGLTTDAVEKNHFDNFIGYLSKQDKTRIGDFKNRDVTELNGRIEQIRTAWKAKYGKDFDLDKKIVFNDSFAILQGEISDPALALTDWPVPVTAFEAMKASQLQRPDDDGKALKQAEADAKLDKGRNVALVRIPAGHGLPEMTVSMIHELPDQWRFDIPNDRTGQQIYDDLKTQLTYLGDHMNTLPADVNDAYRMVAHMSLAALYGVEREPMNAMQRP
jgi:hypothetical protein